MDTRTVFAVVMLLSVCLGIGGSVTSHGRFRHGNAGLYHRRNRVFLQE